VVLLPVALFLSVLDESQGLEECFSFPHLLTSPPCLRPRNDDSKRQLDPLKVQNALNLNLRGSRSRAILLKKLKGIAEIDELFYAGIDHTGILNVNVRIWPYICFGARQRFPVERNVRHTTPKDVRHLLEPMFCIVHRKGVNDAE
jgi:hypothetical protein